MKRSGHHVRQLLILAGSVALSARGGSLSLENHVLSGGGGRGAAGRFQLEGSIGQPVAESAPSVADPKALRAGYWSQMLRWLNAAPVAREDVVERRTGDGAHVLITTLMGNDFDADFESLQFVGTEAASTGGGSIFRDGPWIFYEPSAASPNLTEDTFGYSISDASGAVTTGLVRVRLAGVPAGGAPNALQVEVLGGPTPSVRVRFRGLPGRTYEVQAASDPAGPWAGLASPSADAEGTILFTEPLSAGLRFYRLVEPGP